MSSVIVHDSSLIQKRNSFCSGTLTVALLLCILLIKLHIFGVEEILSGNFCFASWVIKLVIVFS